jgi:hypothetical protein
MAMTDADRSELMNIVLNAIDANGFEMVRECIAFSNLSGQVDGTVVTDENLHLFRQYRNSYGPTHVLIDEAAYGKAPKEA